MLQARISQNTEAVKQMNVLSTFPIEIRVQSNRKMNKLLEDLFSNSSWFNRKVAAQRIGDMRKSDYLPELLDRVTTDPFWMVRCAIIQALEKIGDPRAIPALREVEKSDGFQTVRAYAATAIERLSSA